MVNIEIHRFVIVEASGLGLRTRHSLRLVVAFGLRVAALGRSSRGARRAVGVLSSSNCINSVEQGLKSGVEVSVGGARSKHVEVVQDRIELGSVSDLRGVAGARSGVRRGAKALPSSGCGRSNSRAEIESGELPKRAAWFPLGGWRTAVGRAVKTGQRSREHRSRWSLQLQVTPTWESVGGRRRF